MKQEDIINQIFNKFSEFKKHIKIMFKNINIKCTAERELNKSLTERIYSKLCSCVLKNHF